MASAPGISFEFFPPRTAEQRRVFDSTTNELMGLGPDFLSVTFGAGGSTLEPTRETVTGLMAAVGVPVAPHVSCMVPSRYRLKRLLGEYVDKGVRRLVVLRGDKNRDRAGPESFRFANELVSWIRQEFDNTFRIEVGCYPEVHPESSSAESELKFFRHKVEAGADGAITQYFFNADSYFRFLEDLARLRVDIPITPGIMPITNYRRLARFSEMCGAEIPRWIRRRLESYADDSESVLEFGVEVVTGLCDRLLQGGAPGLHIYTLNRSKAILRLWRNLAGHFPR